MASEWTDVGGFGCLISAEPAERGWFAAGFPMKDGAFWTFREPDAVVIVQNDRLRVAAVPFTRGHDEVQFFDNAKHMYFSTRRLRGAGERAAHGRVGDVGADRRTARTTTSTTAS